MIAAQHRLYFRFFYQTHHYYYYSLLLLDSLLLIRHFFTISTNIEIHSPQMIAAQQQLQLHTVNCHMHTEGADFIGGLRPVRERVEGDDRLFEWVGAFLSFILLIYESVYYISIYICIYYKYKYMIGWVLFMSFVFFC